MDQMIEAVRGTLTQMLPGLTAAVLILVVGWVAALVIRATLRRALGAVQLNHYFRQATGSALDLELGIAAGAYYLILLMMIIAFLNALHLDRTTEPLQALTGAVFAFIPKLMAAGVLLLVAWVLAMVARAVVSRALRATTLDESLAAGAGIRPFGDSAGNVLYWLIMLLFLPAVLGALELHGLLGPVQGMVHEMLTTLPNVLAAGVIAGAGWWIAKIARELVANLLAAAGADRAAEAAGLRGPMTLSRLVGLVVYIAILVPTVIAALQALRLESVSGPASRMLEQALAAVPNILGAGLIVVIAWFVARLVSRLAATLLEGIGFDRLPAALGIGQAFEGLAGPSQLVGRLIVLFIMLFAGVEAAGRLGFTQVSRIVSSLIEFGGHVLLGSVIIAVGFWLSNLAAAAVLRVSGETARGVAGVVRYGVLGLVVAMGLRAMGVADDIVNLAFGLTLGGIAVAAALSFGLGGREAAGRQMEHWLSRLRGDRQP